MSTGSAENLPPGTVLLPSLPTTSYTPIEWNWDAEFADRKHEAKVDAARHDVQPFPVDRRVLRDILREKTRCEVGRITFLSSGELLFGFPFPTSLPPILNGHHQGRFIKSVEQMLSSALRCVLINV